MPVTAFVRQTPQTAKSYDRWDGYKTYGEKPRPITSYDRRHYEHVGGPTVVHSGATMGWRAGYELRLEYARSYNRAYAKFTDAMSEVSELGTTLAEYRSAHQMFMKRGQQLLRGWTYLKQGKFRRFLQTFDIVPNKRDRQRRFNKPKQAGGLWLEYWMGWAPTVGDLHQSAIAMATSVNMTTIRVSARQPFTVLDPYMTWRAGGATICLLQAEVEVVNPNLDLAARLGLINPVSIMYNLMPWSWMLGWFVNFSQVINSFSDFAGKRLHRAFRTYHSVWNSAGFGDSAKYIGSYRSVQTRRTPLLLTLPRPYLRFTMPKELSVTRAATLISLLVQRFKD